MTGERALDIVVYGATGFVGKLIAAYLAEHAPAEVKIGLAGRSQEKLERTRSELGPNATGWPLVVANSDDPESIAAMARGARVVLTTVGPYRRGGIGVVNACIEAGTDYADLTGEVLFVNETKGLHERAVEHGARIVHSCGFDSIPSDLGVLLLHETAAAEGAGDLEDTTLVVRAMKGGASGGTIASLKGQVDDVKKDGAARKVIGDPYALSPDRGADPKGDDEGDLRGVARDEKLGGWIGPFIMAGYNTRIVRRSNALKGWAYGKGFRYREVMGLGGGPVAPVKAAALAGGLGALAVGLAIPPTRKVLDKALPDPGEGPSEEARNTGFFKIDIHTRTSSGTRYVAKVAAKGDPGYAATAMMMGECGLCLALDADRLPAAGGVLTPATAMGNVLTERLRAAGMTFSVERV